MTIRKQNKSRAKIHREKKEKSKFSDKQNKKKQINAN